MQVNGVTWKALLALLAMLTSIAIASAGVTLSAHAASPHRDAVSLREFQMVIERLASMEAKLDRLIERGNS